MPFTLKTTTTIEGTRGCWYCPIRDGILRYEPHYRRREPHVWCSSVHGLPQQGELWRAATLLHQGSAAHELQERELEVCQQGPVHAHQILIQLLEGIAYTRRIREGTFYLNIDPLFYIRSIMDQCATTIASKTIEIDGIIMHVEVR